MKYLKATIADIERQIAQLQRVQGALQALVPENHRVARHVSLAGRRKIAAAQRKRWAKVKRVKSRR